MSQLIIRGGSRLQGETEIQGAKNSVLPILAATLLTAGQVELRGCPRLRDVDASVRILKGLGCTARWEGENILTVDTRNLSGCAVSETLMREMRSSAIFLGAILARCGQAELSYPGGCELGPGPSTCISPGCGAWGRRSTMRAAFCTAGPHGFGDGRPC